MSDELLLVTGASSDLGLALLRRVAAQPDAPRLVAHVHAGAERLHALQAELGDRLGVVQADFSDRAAVAALGERIEKEHGVPRQLVHLPGLPLRYERFTKFDWPYFQRDLSVQLESAIVLLQRFLPKLQKRPRGKIVFVLSSVTRGVPPKFLSMYTVLKHAQLGLVKALASEYAGTPITVNAVSPSMIETRFLGSIPEVAVQMAAQAHPRGRNATPDDVVGAIAFLLSPASDYMTGVELPVTGGSTF